MVYEHGVWTVEVAEHKDFRRIEHEVSFYRTVRLDRECELFVLLKKSTEEAFVRLQLFDDGTIHSEVYSPSLLQIDSQRKFILIGLFDWSMWPKIP